MDRMITLTEERLDKAKTPNGGYNAKQLRAIGVGYPAKKGWKDKLVGQKIRLSEFLRFVIASKNKVYIEEIEAALPKLEPPIVGTKPNLDLPTLLSQHENQAKPKSTLSKKEKKLLRTQQKREKRKAERVQRIINFGIHRAVDLIVDSHEQQLSTTTESFLKWMTRRNEDDIEFDNIHKVYGLLKMYGISLSYTANGHVISKSFTRTSKTKSEQLLYVIRAKGTDFCKIGISKDPKSRKRALQTSNPHPLTISLVLNTDKNAVTLEKSLHKHFRKHCRQGEWFEGVDNESILRVIGQRAEAVKDY